MLHPCNESLHLIMAHKLCNLLAVMITLNPCFREESGLQN
jgi:hypothetical protein